MDVKRLQLNLNLTGVIVIVAVGVLLPVMLLTAAGIVALVIARDAVGIVTGVLVVSFAVTAAGSALIAVVLTGKKARLARLQADFVANVSHELRTPLSVIKLYAQTLQSGKKAGDSQQTDQCLAIILRETDWLDAMIDRVLSWRAASKDTLPLRMDIRPVSRAVAEAAERFRAMVAPDNLVFSFSADTRIRVRHDPLALTDVILNLLTNAYKFTGNEKRITLSVRDADGGVAIEVGDNGVGLTPAEAKRIFQPFYRVEKPAGGRTSGVGLGLAIAQHMVHRHEGVITVRSDKGKGSVFTIRLPAAPEAS